MNLLELGSLLKKCWLKETSSDLNGWKRENPAWGQCAITALIVQDFFGGEIVRSSLENVKGFKLMRSHYFNCLPDGNDVDLTLSQFPRDIVIPKGEIKKREYLLSSPGTRERYVILRLLLEARLSGDNPLFSDEIYRKCFETALDSDCQKMKFACLVFHNNKLIIRAYNKKIEALRPLCEPECIRLKIPSRTESMIGACGHAEEWALWETVKVGIPLNECSFYIAGFGAANKPWVKQECEDHTCLRCAVQMYMAGVGKIYVPVVNKWKQITTEKAVKSASAYALGQKKL